MRSGCYGSHLEFGFIFQLPYVGARLACRSRTYRYVALPSRYDLERGPVYIVGNPRVILIDSLFRSLRTPTHGLRSDDQSTNFLITSRILNLLHFFSRNASKFFLRIVFEIYFGLIFYPQNYALIFNQLLGLYFVKVC